MIAEAMFDGAAERLIQKCMEMAFAGDPVALRICLDRIIPARKDRYVTFRLPPIKTAKDAVAAIESIAMVASEGELTIPEADGVAKIVDSISKAIELT